jgi:hypothetical protein
MFQPRRYTRLGSSIPTLPINSTTSDPSASFRNLSCLWENLPSRLLGTHRTRCKGSDPFLIGVGRSGPPSFLRLAVSWSIFSFLSALKCILLTPTSLSSQRAGVWDTANATSPFLNRTLVAPPPSGPLCEIQNFRRSRTYLSRHLCCLQFVAHSVIAFVSYLD